MTTLIEAASLAANSLLNKAKQHNIILPELTLDNFNTVLDDLFNDGGEVRCVHFIDLTNKYACRFGPIESTKWEEARWPCIEKAIELVNKRRNK